MSERALELLAILVSIALYLAIYVRAIINNEVERVEENESKIIQRNK